MDTCIVCFCVSSSLIGKKDEKLVENGIILFVREKHTQIRIEQILCPNKRKLHVFVFKKTSLFILNLGLHTYINRIYTQFLVSPLMFIASLYFNNTVFK